MCKILYSIHFEYGLFFDCIKQDSVIAKTNLCSFLVQTYEYCAPLPPPQFHPHPSFPPLSQPLALSLTLPPSSSLLSCPPPPFPPSLPHPLSFPISPPLSSLRFIKLSMMLDSWWRPIWLQVTVSIRRFETLNLGSGTTSLVRNSGEGGIWYVEKNERRYFIMR